MIYILIYLVCCHRARSWSIYLFLLSIFCIACAVTLIVLDALFNGNIDRCFFAEVICEDLRSTNNFGNGQPLGRKVQVLKAQMACAAALIATAVLYILAFIGASLSSRGSKNVVLIEQREAPLQHVRQTIVN